MNEITIFNYNGSDVSFQNGENIMINATEMAKPFGKTAKDWLRTNASSEFISSLSAVRQICPSQLVIVRKGNSSEFEQGTWMHEDVALEFARWLSPQFAIWCNDKVKELLKNGVTTVNDDDATILHAMQVLQKRVEEKQRALNLAQTKITFQDALLNEQVPKVAFANAIEASKSSCLIGELAKIITQNGYEIG